jgi:hypothetical protein
MSEILCPCCGAASPAEALFCMRCGEPIKCKNCGAGILANARACIKCGALIPQREPNDRQFGEMGLVPPGYNRLRVREKADSYSYDADFVFSDIFAQQTGTGEVIAQLGGIGERASSSRPVSPRPGAAHGVVEVAEQTLTVPQLVAGPDSGEPPSGEAPAGQNGVVSAEVRAIHTVFDEDDGKLTLQVPDLKAVSQTDYTLRLVHMFLYARKVLFSETSTTRGEIFEVTEFANLPRENVSVYLNRDGGMEKAPNGESLSLNLSGLDHARKCLNEIMDPAVPPGKWTPSTKARSAPRARKAAKRSDAPIDADEMATLVAHPETQALVRDIPHERFTDLPILDQVIVALYGFNKARLEDEVYYGAMAQYLFDAFDIKVSSESIRSSLRTALSHRNKYILHKDKEGYRITQSGIRYVETSLRGKGGNSLLEQPELLESGNE